MIIRITEYGAISCLMIVLGALALLLSAFYSTYFLSSIGLGLVFWGILFLYIRPSKHVRLELLNATSFSSLENIERILLTAKTKLKGIYLPPNNLPDNSSSLVFVPKKADQPLPTYPETNTQELYSENKAGLFVTPPGLALSRLLEKELRKTFLKTSLDDLQKQLPKLFEVLKIAEKITLTTEGNTISVDIRNHIFKGLSEEAMKLEKMREAIGSPISSALACAFAKATGKPVTIEKEETNEEGTTTILYNVLEN